MKNEQHALALQAYLQETHANRFPLKDHPLAQASPEAADVYLEMLGNLYLYVDMPIPEQLNFLKRLIATSQLSKTAADYLDFLNELDPVRYETFVSLVGNEELRSSFILDSMLLLRLGKVNPKELQLLANIFESLRATETETRQMAWICAAVLEQNYAKYKYLLWKEPAIKDCFSSYFSRETPSQYVTADCAILYRCTSEQMKQVHSWQDKDYVLLQCCSVLLDSFALSFKNITLLQWEGCFFCGGKTQPNFFEPRDVYRTSHSQKSFPFELPEFYSITCEHCPSIIVSDCHFSNFRTAAIELDSKCRALEINNSSFDHCIRYFYNRDRRDGYCLCNHREFADHFIVPCVIITRNSDAVLLANHCSFTCCGGKCLSDILDSNAWSYGSELYYDSVLSNCHFPQFEQTNCTFQDIHISFYSTESRHCMYESENHISTYFAKEDA